MLSAVVLTKNEQDCLERCLKSLSFCDEIIIIDDYSSDLTLSIAKKYTDKIYQKQLNDDFSKQRNFGLTKTRGNWIFFLDADEIVPKSLKHEIIKTLKQDRNINFNGYFINRKDIFLGKRMHYGEVANIQLLRLAKKNQGVWKRPVHEVWQIKGKIGVLKNPIQHFAHENIRQLLQKINYYSTINARYLKSQKTPVSIIDVIVYPITKFTLNFILKRGFLDGTGGFLLSVFMSFHSFLTRAKLYILSKNEQK